MKLSKLLSRRPDLLRQVRLANVAFAYDMLGGFADRIQRAGLHGWVTLKPADPDASRCYASLTLLDGNQSVIEEHFTDEDLLDLADMVVFSIGHNAAEITFRIEGLADYFIEPLRVELQSAGVDFGRSFPRRRSSPRHQVEPSE
jgi:hypothetical protein